MNERATFTQLSAIRGEIDGLTLAHGDGKDIGPALLSLLAKLEGSR